MKQIDNISKALTAFRMAAAAQVAATENGDYKKGNNAFDRVIHILKHLKELGKLNELEAIIPGITTISSRIGRMISHTIITPSEIKSQKRLVWHF